MTRVQTKMYFFYNKKIHFMIRIWAVSLKKDKTIFYHWHSNTNTVVGAPYRNIFKLSGHRLCKICSWASGGPTRQQLSSDGDSTKVVKKWTNDAHRPVIYFFTESKNSTSKSDVNVRGAWCPGTFTVMCGTATGIQKSRGVRTVTLRPPKSPQKPNCKFYIRYHGFRPDSLKIFLYRWKYI